MIIGKITKQIEKETNGEIKSGSIRVSVYHLNDHIPNVHKKELEQLGIDALDYIKFIVENFTEIRSGSGNSYLLIGPHKSANLKNVAAITLEYLAVVDENGVSHYWEVRTAQPRPIKRIEKRKLVWKNK